MKAKHLIIISIISIFLTGCYDYKEINNIAIVTATELSIKDNEYLITAQVVNPQAPDKTANPQAPFIIYTSTGKTLQEAYRNIVLESSRFLYSNHLQLLIINEKLAQDDVNQIIDLYLRNPSIRSEFYIMIGKNDNILNIITPIDDISSNSIKENIETNSKFQGITNKVTFNEFVNMIINPNLEVILPSIELIDYSKEGEDTENTKKTTLESKYKLDGLSIFKDSKLIGYLTKDESLSYNIIKNNITNTIINCRCPENGEKYITIEVTKNKTKIKFDKNTKTFNISVNITGNLNESHCNLPIKSAENIKEINKLYEEYLTEKLTKDINKIKDTYNSDVFGFLDIIYKNDYNYYQQIKNTWQDETYKNTEITVSTKVNIVEKGNSLEVVNEKNK